MTNYIKQTICGQNNKDLLFLLLNRKHFSVFAFKIETSCEQDESNDTTNRYGVG
ncbi:hypothetical protein HMPREF1870_01655 [Bacteroidales bacterium KA00344]|nr:hypothetical protein HMPREF1870_01655 [Bacteroidales bacterium KA00344]